MLALSIFASLINPLRPQVSSAQTSRVSTKSPQASPQLFNVGQYAADFDESPSRGVGVRFRHKPSDQYVDVRLVGHPGSEPRVRGRSAEFAPSEKLRVVYEVLADGVKESIISHERVSTYEFKVHAPGLKMRQDGANHVLADRHDADVFKILAPTAWDAHGNRIGATAKFVGEKFLVTLDPSAVAAAPLPITVDPTIQGATWATAGAHNRKLLAVGNSRVIMLYVESAPTVRVVFRLSSDEGVTWTEPTAVAETAAHTVVSGVHLGGGVVDVLYTSKAAGAGTGFIARRRLTPAAVDTWSVGPESIAVATGSLLEPAPTLVVRTDGPAGRRLAIGYARTGLLGGVVEYVTSLSDNDGATWNPATICDAGPDGTIAAVGSRLVCFSTDPGLPGLEWREWLNGTWVPQTTIPIGDVKAMPSTVATGDGELHLAVAVDDVGDDDRIRYARLLSAGASWSSPVTVGVGSEPVIADTGEWLGIEAYDRVSADESVLRTYLSQDRTSWRAEFPRGGADFSFVLDYNEAWDFTSGVGDALFSLSGGGVAIGNRIGVDSQFHRLDSIDKRLAFAFKATSSASVSNLKLWYRAQDARTYRIGIQSDSSAFGGPEGTPSGRWINATASLADDVPSSGAYVETGLPTSTVGSAISLTIPAGSVLAQTVYHLVAEPSGVLPPTSANWAEFESVGTDAGAVGAMAVRSFASSTNWVQAQDRVPRMVVGSSYGGLAADQQIGVGSNYATHEYLVSGQRFVSPTTGAIDSARLLLAPVGSPTPGHVLVRLLDASGAQVSSGTIGAPTPGWVTAPLDPVTIQAGNTYHLVVDFRGRDRLNTWSIKASGDSSASWDDGRSSVTTAPDRKGFNDRTDEAKSVESGRDLIAFNSGSGDVLYIGGERPFDYVRLQRDPAADPGGAVGVSAQYWKEDQWAPLPTERQSLGVAGWDGDMYFTKPGDWARSSVNGTTGHWIRIVPLQAAPQMTIAKLSGARDLNRPTAVGSGISGAMVTASMWTQAPDALAYLFVMPPVIGDVFSTLVLQFNMCGNNPTNAHCGPRGNLQVATWTAREMKDRRAWAATLNEVCKPQVTELVEQLKWPWAAWFYETVPQPDNDCKSYGNAIVYRADYLAQRLNEWLPTGTEQRRRLDCITLERYDSATKEYTDPVVCVTHLTHTGENADYMRALRREQLIDVADYLIEIGHGDNQDTRFSPVILGGDLNNRPYDSVDAWQMDVVFDYLYGFQTGEPAWSSVGELFEAEGCCAQRMNRLLEPTHGAGKLDYIFAYHPRTIVDASTEDADNSDHKRYWGRVSLGEEREDV
ncbi:MAG TPA: hypothetical protein VNE62_06090 [Actinomycetota bacterium]|nr:hypothetical protein [Actinomycetota bacterium]